MLNTCQRVTAALMLMLMVACGPAKPKPIPTVKPEISYSVVEICVEPTSERVRFSDDLCDRFTKGYRWIYVTDDKSGTGELPAVGETLLTGRIDRVTPVADIGRVPAQGAHFKR